MLYTRSPKTQYSYDLLYKSLRLPDAVMHADIVGIR